MAVTSSHVQTLLNGTIQSLQKLIPLNLNIQTPSLLTDPFVQEEIGVLVGLTGDIKGRVIIDSTTSTFSAIGTKMFGMSLEGAMLESFTGEFGNMFAGSLCVVASEQNLTIDITPPTVLVGNTKLYGFEKAFKLPTLVEDVGILNVLFTIEENS